MKPVKWLVLALLLVTAALLLMQQRERGAVATAPVSPPAEEAAGVSPAPEPPAAPSGAAATAVPAAAGRRSAKFPEEREAENHLQVSVQSESGQPLEGAIIRTSFRAEQRRPVLTNFSRSFTTTSHGLADVVWPTKEFAQFVLLVSKDNYAPRKMVWDLKTGDVIPRNYTVKLKSGVHVGGMVVDPEGNPVEDATVALTRFWSGGEAIKVKGEEPDFPTQKQTTGADGRWTARNLPPELLERIFISASHSNFVAVTVSMDGKPQIEAECRQGTYLLQLKRGIEISGRVINEAQQPVADATVWAGRKFSRERQETKSDAQGRFKFRNLNEGKVDFSVSADGYAPATKSQAVSARAGEVLFQLVKGSVIRGTVQDESGQPIGGVRVALAGSPGDPAYDAYEFSTTTDAEGKFEWKGTPNSPMPFYFGKTGYEQKRDQRLKPGVDNIVTLRLNRQVQGQVLDADTEKPVTRFTIAVGRYRGENQFYSVSAGAREFKSEQGMFTVELHEEEENAIQITANGYAEQAQMLPQPEAGQIQVVLKLKPSKSLSGTVVRPDGQPAAGVGVALVESNPGGKSVQFARGRLRSSGSQSKLVTTDESGRFEIPSPPEIGTVVAASEAGFASASVAEVRASGVLALQPFGRIDGVLVQGATAGANQELLLNSPIGGVGFEFETTKQITDAEGRFVFTNVPAGTHSIVRLIKTSLTSWRHSHRTDIVVASGQTTQVVLGGVDATLYGHVRFEAAPPETEYTLSALLSSPTPQVPAGLSPEERKAFLNSPGWKEQLKNMQNYSTTVAADGTLVLDSVAPGQYTLQVTASKSDEQPSGFAKPLAHGETTITVPAGAAPTTPLQVGEILLKLVK